MQDYSDEKLVKRFLKGDKASLEILVKRHLKSVYSFVYRFVGNAADADDVTQEVFVKMWKNLKKFDKKKVFKTWIFSIARNTAIDLLRKRKTLPLSAFDDEDGGNAIADNLTDPAPLPDEVVEHVDTARLIKAAMEKLSENYRVVIFLRYYSDFTFRKIAELTGVSVNTAKSRHARALVVLKEKLAGIQ